MGITMSAAACRPPTATPPLRRRSAGGAAAAPVVRAASTSTAAPPRFTNASRRGGGGRRSVHAVVTAMSDRASTSPQGGEAREDQAPPRPFTRLDLEHMLRAVELSDGAAGLCQPHPKSGCVLVGARGTCVAEAFQFGQGGVRAEVFAAEAAAGAAVGGIAYLNLEPVHGPSAGEDAAVGALVASGVARVVIGILHPVAGTRGEAAAALRAAGVAVHVLSDCGGGATVGAAAAGAAAGVAAVGAGPAGTTAAAVGTAAAEGIVALAAKTAGAKAGESGGGETARNGVTGVEEVAPSESDSSAESAELEAAAVAACRTCNRAVLYRCATGRA